MKKIYYRLLIAVLIMPLCATAQKVRVAVAANAQFVSEALATEFKRTTGITAEMIVGSSGKLTAQIEQGAPFDVFLSADTKYPQALYDKGLTTQKPKTYALGVMVLWTIKDIRPSLPILARSQVKKIAIANPELAPYGQAAMECLKVNRISGLLKDKLVIGESIAQVNQYLLTGAVEAAFTARSVVMDPELKDKGNWTVIDPRTYHPMRQGVVILKNAANPEPAQKFYDFLFSDAAKKIFEQYGYR